MNPSITDSLYSGYPEVIEGCLKHGVMKCIAFNRRGTFLAAGCSDGSCVIWDFMTRGIAKELRDNDCDAAIISVCWSRSGHHILVSADDKSLTLWNVVKGEKVFQTILQQTPLHASLHPGGRGLSPPSLCLVSPFSSAPLILNFHTKTTTLLPTLLSDSGTGLATSSCNNFSDGSTHYTPTAACFNKFGDLVYLGNSVGEILIIDHKTNKVCGIFPIPGGAVIKNITFSRNGQYLLTNSGDRTSRIYKNLLPLKDSHKIFGVNETNDTVSEIEKLKAVGLKCLSLFQEFQDSITKVHWKAVCFSGDSELVVGACASKGEHKLYIWDKSGFLVQILEGPKAAIVDLAWHPVRPIVVSVSVMGLAYVWAKDYTESWSAFAPDFKELEENEEYVEQEDEFDLMPENKKVKESALYEDEVDITTVEKDSLFSDSDISDDELYFLQSEPCLDFPVLPVSEEGTRVNGQATNHDSNQVEALEKSGAEDTGRTRVKRWKPSKKLLELHASETTQNTKASENARGEDTGRTHVKRSRKSKKLLELQEATQNTKASECAVQSFPTLDGDESMRGLNEVKPPNKGKLYSDVWNSFKKVKKSDGQIVAVCKHCSIILSGDGGTSHLRYHIKKKHAEHVVSVDCSNVEGVSTPDVVECMTGFEEVNPSVQGKLKSIIWNHFKKIRKSNNRIVAVCNHCSKKVVAGDARNRNMKNHLRKKHAGLVSANGSNMEIVPIPNDDEPITGVEEANPSTQGMLTSMVWNHFERVKKSDSKIVAVCNHCSLNLVAGDAGTSSLRNHLKRKHAELIVSADCSNSENVVTPDGDEPIAGNKKVKCSKQGMLKSMVWNHFKRVSKSNNRSVAVCNHCSINFSGDKGTTHLRYHLEKKHAELIVSADCSNMEILPTSNGDVAHGEVIVSTDGNHMECNSTKSDDESTEYEEVNIPNRRKITSVVWKYFKKVKKRNDDKIFAVCNFCDAHFASGGAGTNHLRNHLKRKHIELSVS